MSSILSFEVSEAKINKGICLDSGVGRQQQNQTQYFSWHGD